MYTRSKAPRGFTLIEILIVVVILGILAAIVIPQFTDAAQDANVSSARSQLQSMRSQIELYRVQNNGQMPGASSGSNGAAPWGSMIDDSLIRSAPNWPLGFVESWSATTGLSLTFDTGANPSIPDVNGDGNNDATDVTAIANW
ncbi:MAG: hypothetical protein CMJ32_10425 [Phycisphaerae bacterium]|nr:hypothetical protein [Phycisphaerae bacterium]